MSPRQKKPLDTFNMKLPIKLIDCSNDFPRRQDLGDLGDLSRSLSKAGLIEPIIVGKKPEGGYDLICGWRRLNAAKAAGWGQIPAVIKDSVSDLEFLKLRLIENLKRKDLEIFELVDLISALRKTMHPQEIADTIGWDRATVETYLKLRGLPRDMLLMVVDGKRFRTAKDLSVNKAATLAMAALTDDSVRQMVGVIQEYGLTLPQLKKELTQFVLKMFKKKAVEMAAAQGTETLLEYAMQEVKLEKKYKPHPDEVRAQKAAASPEYARWAALVTVRRHLRKLEKDAKSWGLGVILREHPSHITFILKLTQKPKTGEPREKSKLKPSDAQEIKKLIHAAPDGRFLIRKA